MTSHKAESVHQTRGGAKSNKRKRNETQCHTCMKAQKAHLLQLVPNQGEAIPVPAQAHLQIVLKGRATEVPSLENYGWLCIL